MRALALAVVLAPLAASAQAYRLPLDPGHCAAVPGGHCYVTAYYDLQDGAGVRDWSCGTNSYDGHRGTDLGVGSWPGMDRGVDVLAAADGVVESAHDGEFDRCSSADCGEANYVILRHADGKRTLYWHLKKFSVAVSVGQQVSCGQRLGQVGSSGRSTGPHLHFQVNVSGSPDDPFRAASGCGGPISYWVDQGGYDALPGVCCEGGCVEPPRDDAAYVGQDPPDGLRRAPGERFSLSFTLRNTGNTTWTRAERYLLTRDGDEPADPRMGGPEQIELAEGEEVPPGAEKTFTFEVTAAAATGGPYRAWYRMDRYGTARFGGRMYLEHHVDAPVDPDADGDGVTVGGGDCDDGSPAIRPGTFDLCDGRDEDCDGVADEDAAPLPCESACGAGVSRCEAGAYGACDAPRAGVEICDGQDDDCDGAVDDGDGLCPDGQACVEGSCRAGAGGRLPPPAGDPGASAEAASGAAIEGGCSAGSGRAGLAPLAVLLSLAVSSAAGRAASRRATRSPGTR